MAIRTDSPFSREQLAGYDPEVLAGATVLVVGGGALAQNLLVNLALSGVGELRIVDFDRFESHNAPRSPLFPSADEQVRWGMEKARVVANKTLALAQAEEPTVLYATKPIQALGAGAFEAVDVVAACVDNAEARAYLADMCRWLGVSLVEGGFDGPKVTLSSFPASSAEAAGGDACYRCGNPSLVGTFSCQRQALAAIEAGITPAIQAAAATLGGLQAEAVIQALQGEHPTALRRTNLDIRTGRQSQYELVADPECQGIHRRAGNLVELKIESTDTALALLEAIERDLGPGCTIELPDRLVWEAFCDACGAAVAVEAPDWAWRAGPLCTECGGDFPKVAEVPDDYTPTIVPSLDRSLSAHLLDSPCATVGIRPRDVVEAEADGQAKQYRLGGDLGELFVRAASIS
jgi:molybdopterin/thiamine biosynthesis adenylyltransferase